MVGSHYKHELQLPISIRLLLSTVSRGLRDARLCFHVNVISYGVARSRSVGLNCIGNKKSTHLGLELILAESPSPFSRSLVQEDSILKTSTGDRNRVSVPEKSFDDIPVVQTRETTAKRMGSRPALLSRVDLSRK